MSNILNQQDGYKWPKDVVDNNNKIDQKDVRNRSYVTIYRFHEDFNLLYKEILF